MMIYSIFVQYLKHRMHILQERSGYVCQSSVHGLVCEWRYEQVVLKSEKEQKFAKRSDPNPNPNPTSFRSFVDYCSFSRIFAHYVASCGPFAIRYLSYLFRLLFTFFASFRSFSPFSNSFSLLFAF